jgi:hypothetical protein
MYALLKEFVAEQCITIITRVTDAPQADVVARTVLQLDGGIITSLRENIQREECERHFRNIDARLTPLRRWTAAVQSAGWAMLIGGQSSWLWLALHRHARESYSIALGVLGIAMKLLLPRALRALLRRTLRSALEQP